MDDLTDFELKVMRCVAGERVPGMAWGAAMGEAVEYLYGGGYLARGMSGGALQYHLTDKGIEALTAARQPKEDQP